MWPAGNGLGGRGGVFKGEDLLRDGWEGPGGKGPAGRGLRGWGRQFWDRSQARSQPPGTLALAKPKRVPRLAARRCSSFYNLPTERYDLRKICHKDVCRCAEGEGMGTREPGLPGWESRSPLSLPECCLG